MEASAPSTNRSKGLLIATEGPDCFGKTVLCDKICEHIRPLRSTIKTSQPESTSNMGKFLRDEALSGRYEEGTWGHYGLFWLNRTLAYERVVVPLLEQDFVVILDRFFLSPIAYNVIGHPLEVHLKEILQMELRASQGRVPDLVFFLHSSSGKTDPYNSMERRKDKLEHYDKFDDTYKKKLHKNYEHALNIYKHLSTFELGVEAKQVVRIDVDKENNFEEVVVPALSKLLEMTSCY